MGSRKDLPKRVGQSRIKLLKIPVPPLLLPSSPPLPPPIAKGEGKIHQPSIRAIEILIRKISTKGVGTTKAAQIGAITILEPRGNNMVNKRVTNSMHSQRRAIWQCTALYVGSTVIPPRLAVHTCWTTMGNTLG